MIYGKLVAAVLGFLVAGPIGLLVGLALGHWFDRGLQRTLGFSGPEHLARARAAFFETSFLLLGHIAKADGRVSEAEISHVEGIMGQLGIGGTQRDAAIALFKRGTGRDLDVDTALAEFRDACAGHRPLAHSLLVFLISLALADGHVESGERNALERVALLLGYSQSAFEQLLRMVEAQAHFHDYRPGAAPSHNQLDDAYQALGVSAACSDRELKTAYRRLMSQHHPDKLIAQGVPEEMLAVATEKSQEIQAAYELVRKHRRQA
jgi:DnaJ like chaperone protein